MITTNNQKFGVEIEFTGMRTGEAARIIANVLNVRYNGGNSVYDNQNRLWQIVYDGSIRTFRGDSCELVSPILTYDDIETIQEMVRELRKGGMIVNDSCGIHVHVDGSNHTATSLKNVVNFMCARQDLIYEALDVKSNRISYCKKICNAMLKKIKRTKNLDRTSMEDIWYSRVNHNYSGHSRRDKYNHTRYQCLNLHSYFNKGTVEFRMFNATTHAGELKAYIQFSLAVSAWAINSTDNIKFNSISHYTKEQKLTNMIAVLTERLGMSGTEFKTARLHLTKNLRSQAHAA